MRGYIRYRLEPAGRLVTVINEQELELKTNTELTRAIHALTTELHRRLLEDPTP